MAVLERRLQLLLDEDRYSWVAAEAKRTGRSVAAVIREAIDVRYAADSGRRRAAARLLLSTSDSDSEPGDDWDDVKAALEQDILDRLP